MFVFFEKKYYFCNIKINDTRNQKARDFVQSIPSILYTLTGLEYFDTKDRATAGRGVGQGKLKRGGRCTAERTPCLFGSKMLGN